MGQMYFSASKEGFCPDDVYGTKTIDIPDPEWIRPTIEVPDPNWIAPADEPTAAHPMITIPDASVPHPLITVPNPDCTLPTDAVEVTMETYNAIRDQLKTGMLLSADTNGNPIAMASPTVLLATLQSDACNEIDSASGRARAKYITVVNGQDAVYQMKLDEAKAYQAAANPVATDYPHLSAEATQTGTPIADVANLVVSTYNQWVQLSAKIEGYRRGGNVSVNKATDAAGVQAALQEALTNLAGC